MDAPTTMSDGSLPAGLAPYPERFARALFAQHPEWRAFARVDGSDSPTPGALHLVIPAPSEGRAPLEIEADEEVTLYYDRWHGHYDEWSGDASRPFGGVLDAIAKLLADEYVVAVDERAGKWVGSMFTAPKAMPPAKPGDNRYMRSWTGRADSGHRTT